MNSRITHAIRLRPPVRCWKYIFAVFYGWCVSPVYVSEVRDWTAIGGNRPLPPTLSEGCP
jgi:hypothetical protein